MGSPIKFELFKEISKSYLCLHFIDQTWIICPRLAARESGKVTIFLWAGLERSKGNKVLGVSVTKKEEEMFLSLCFIKEIFVIIFGATDLIF